MTLEAPQASDAELVAAVRKKDRKATAEFVSRYSGALYSYLRRRLMPRQDVVDDLFQQVFLEAWQQLASYRGESGVKAWLLGIARHKVQSHYRILLRESQIDENGEEPEASGDLAALFDKQVSHERVWAVLTILPEDARVLLLWRYWEGWSAEAMASAAGKTVKGVERALARARAQFKEHWHVVERQGVRSGHE